MQAEHEAVETYQTCAVKDLLLAQPAPQKTNWLAPVASTATGTHRCRLSRLQCLQHGVRRAAIASVAPGWAKVLPAAAEVRRSRRRKRSPEPKGQSRLPRPTESRANMASFSDPQREMKDDSPIVTQTPSVSSPKKAGASAFPLAFCHELSLLKHGLHLSVSPLCILGPRCCASAPSIADPSPPHAFGTGPTSSGNLPGQTLAENELNSNLHKRPCAQIQTHTHWQGGSQKEVLGAE